MRSWLPRSQDRLLRVGATLMFLALACALVALAYAFIGRPPERADAEVRPVTKLATQSAAKPLVRTDPGIDPWVERDIPPPKPRISTDSQAAPGPAHQPAANPQPVSVPQPTEQPKPQQQKTTSSTAHDDPSRAGKQSARANHASHYHLPPGAIMSLTIPSLGIKNAPVRNSESSSALDRGVVHLPDTSLPWSNTPERNVYLAGHRLGWPDTGSYHIFYHLNELTGGEKVTLHGPNGKTYDYRVLENFIVGPKGNWVTGRVKDRDLLTLQTCTPIPTFQYRLIVRAERI